MRIVWCVEGGFKITVSLYDCTFRLILLDEWYSSAKMIWLKLESTAMSRQQEVPLFTDPLGEALHLLKLTGTFYCRSVLSEPWGVELPPFEDCMMFHIITSGHCWLKVEGDPPVLLQQGSLVLLPHGLGHKIVSAEQQETTPLFDIPVETVSERFEVMRFGGGGEVTQLTCGVVRFDHVAGQELIKFLPRVMHINTWAEEEDSWLQSTLRFIAREARELRPGAETVITHLADILIIQAIRSWLGSSPQSNTGWLAGLRDRQIGRALSAIHRNPEFYWTVNSLAKEVGMSRSGFSARFSEIVGESAMRYLTRWRMQLARIQLKNTSDPLIVLAENLGYQSEAAFCRAFKRVFGVSPGSMRQSLVTEN